MCSFFCFKQKTAYEMRISDWSSDVCSSDLATRRETIFGCVSVVMMLCAAANQLAESSESIAEGRAATRRSTGSGSRMTPVEKGRICVRSEEHRSELQSLMRI